MLRRQIRERKEYLYRKAQEERKRATEQRKEKVKAALDNNTPVPTELQADALELQRLMQYDGAAQIDPTQTHEDDEYRWAGVEDPKIMITSSRDPSSKLKMFLKELRLIFPNSQRVNRGGYQMQQLVDACSANGVTDLIIVHEHRGTPNAMDICHLPYGPTAHFTLSNVVMRHDIPGVGPASEAFPHLIFHNFSSTLGQRVKNILRYLYPVPKEDSKRVITFYNEDDFISFRHHVYSKPDHKNVEISEAGPRFEMSVYKISLGTIDKETIAETEWRLHNYTRTARKRKILSTPDQE